MLETLISEVIDIGENRTNNNLFQYDIVVNKGLFGRMRMESGVSEEQLTNPNVVKSVLQDVLEIHQKNVRQINYLIDVERGKQDVLYRTKEFKQQINNKIVENHINHAISFKKGYVFGYPIQYVQVTNNKDTLPPSEPDELNKGFDTQLSKDLGFLNQVFRSNSKSTKDIDLAETLYISGVATRYFRPTPSNKEVPFEIHNLDPRDAGVVYSTDYDKRPLMAFYQVPRVRFDENGKQEKYYEFKVYTARYIYTFESDTDYFDKSYVGDFVLKYKPKENDEQQVNPLGFIPIVEYELNKNRVSIVERMITAQNALNRLTSNEVDDVEQFIQALMVFVNAEVDEETWKMASEAGIINIKSSHTQEGDVKMLTSKLSHTEARVLYDRVLHNMLINVGVPLINVGGGSGGDTGLARLTDNGWLMADTKAREDELAFVKSEKRLLENIVKYLKDNKFISDLEIDNIETKFVRHKSDNLLVKTQSLTNLKGLMHPETAMQIVDLVSDPAEEVRKARDYYGEQYFSGSSGKPLDKELEDGDINNEQTPASPEEA